MNQENQNTELRRLGAMTISNGFAALPTPRVEDCWWVSTIKGRSQV